MSHLNPLSGGPLVVQTQGYTPRRWREQSAIFIANLLALFFGNEEQTSLLEHEISSADSYGARLLPIMGLLFGGGQNFMLTGLLQVGLVAGDFDGFAGFEGVRGLFGSVDDGAEQGLLGGQAVKGGRGDRRGGGDECDHKKSDGPLYKGLLKGLFGDTFS